MLEDIECDQVYDDVQVDFDSVSKQSIALIQGMPTAADFDHV